MKNNKALFILAAAAIASATVLQPKPAQALPKFLDNVLDIVGSSVGFSLGEKLNGYLELGLGKLDKFLGLDAQNLGSITGVLGGIDPIKAYGQIDLKQSSYGLTKEDLAIPSLVEGKLQKGEFSVGLSGAIGNSLLTTDAQEGLKAASDGSAQLTKDSNDLAAKAQKMNVTQDIAKVTAQQNGQEIQILNLQSQKQDLELQQASATTVSTSISAAHANAEERRQQDIYAAEKQHTIQQTGVANGVIGGL